MGRDQTLYPSSLALAKASSDSVVRLSNLRALPMGPIQAVSAICSSRCDYFKCLAGLRYWHTRSSERTSWIVISRPSASVLFSPLGLSFESWRRLFFKSSISAWAWRAASQFCNLAGSCTGFHYRNAFSGFSALFSPPRGQAGWMLCSRADLSKRFGHSQVSATTDILNARS